MATYGFDVHGKEEVTYHYEVSLRNGLTEEEAVKLCQEAWEEGTAKLVDSETHDNHLEEEYQPDTVEELEEELEWEEGWRKNTDMMLVFQYIANADEVDISVRKPCHIVVQWMENQKTDKQLLNALYWILDAKREPKPVTPEPEPKSEPISRPPADGGEPGAAAEGQGCPQAEEATVTTAEYRNRIDTDDI